MKFVSQRKFGRVKGTLDKLDPTLVLSRSYSCIHQLSERTNERFSYIKSEQHQIKVAEMQDYILYMYQHDFFSNYREHVVYVKNALQILGKRQRPLQWLLG